MKVVNNNIARCTRTLNELKEDKYQYELNVARTVLELHRYRSELAYEEEQLVALNKEKA